MKVLLIGSGAREHALGWALRRSTRVTELLSLPGNPGLAALGSTVEGVTPTDVGAVAAVARVHGVDLVVVGPEAPLAAGIVDALDRLGIPAFGPTRRAARLESSKSEAKRVMEAAGVPTPGAATFDEAAAAHSYLASQPGPYVVKADGLAAGKGVLVTADRSAAGAWVDRCLAGGFGEAGTRVVIEDFAAGPELSVFAVCDGTDAVALEPARDYKRLGDGDAGPNTGGMGSYSPVTLHPGLVEDVLDRVIRPTLAQMAAEGTPYVGFLYAGLILTDGGPQVIEFNARLGDPETQVVLPRLQSDLVDLIEAGLGGEVRSVEPAWTADHVVNVVLASPGYPEDAHIGQHLTGNLRSAERSLVFHAGTAEDAAGRLVTAGGRVLSVVGLGADLASAREVAYDRVRGISWAGMQYRTDIAAG